MTVLECSPSAENTGEHSRAISGSDQDRRSDGAPAGIEIRPDRLHVIEGEVERQHLIDRDPLHVRLLRVRLAALLDGLDMARVSRAEGCRCFRRWPASRRAGIAPGHRVRAYR